MRILHLSDTHLDRLGRPDDDGGDGTAALRRLLGELGHLEGLGAVVVTGDVADDGSREAYRRVRAMVGEYAGARGARVFYATGNHDDRAAFGDVLGCGHEVPDEVYDGPRGERAAVSTVDGYRVVTLDSLVPGKGYGGLGEGQLAWLREVLASPAAHGTVLGFHHPPIGVPGVDVHRVFGLRDAEELAGVISGTDVGLVLCGHFHLQLTGRIAQATVWVTPGVVSRIDLTAPPGTERAVHGPSATLVDLAAPHGPLLHTLHARDPRMGTPVYEADTAEMGEVMDRLGS
jgi:3',5'-cyclic-AMP phosphodiesterase